jgi:hypothetical protein
MEVLISMLAALLGVLLDRLSTWHASRKAANDAMRLDRLARRAQVDHINARIDREVARETDLGALVGRL